MSPALAGRLFTTEPPGKPILHTPKLKKEADAHLPLSHPVCSRASSGDCYPQAGFSLRREGCPPSRGPPGCPAFGCSSWPGRWLEGQARAAEERRLPSPAASHPRPPARGFTRAGPPLLTHHSPARRLATECWSRNRASGKGQEQRFLGPSGTFCAFPTLRVCPHRLSSLGHLMKPLLQTRPASFPLHSTLATKAAYSCCGASFQPYISVHYLQPSGTWLCFSS